MTQNRYFKIPGSSNNVKELLSRISTINRQVGKYNLQTSLDSLTWEELNTILYVMEMGALSIRKCMEYKQNNISIYTKNDEINHDSYIKNMPIEVSFYEEKLDIFTPFLFKRSREAQHKNNYVFANYLNVKLQKIYEKQPEILRIFDKNKELVVVIIRQTKEFKFKEICDNDNYEVSRLINEIFPFYGRSDNALNMDLYSCYRNTEPEGMHIIVVPRNRLSEVITTL